MSVIKAAVGRMAARLGYRIERLPRDDAVAFPVDIEPDVRDDITHVKPFTMTSIERLYALTRAIGHVGHARVDGDIVECGVWRGGSMMLAARRLLARPPVERRLWLYDTFEGMSAPTSVDISRSGEPAQEKFDATSLSVDASNWCRATLDEVRGNIQATGYPETLIHYVKGPVEKTIPDTMPEKIAVLRLDTDWYESTRHELEHLYPRLVPGGVLMIDDYGHWQGCRKAVDEYFADRPAPLLARIDYAGRMGVRPPA